MEELRDPILNINNVLAMLSGEDDFDRVPILGPDEESEHGIYFYEIGYYRSI